MRIRNSVDDVTWSKSWFTIADKKVSPLRAPCVDAKRRTRAGHGAIDEKQE
jgi:hypothetical protein